MNFQSIVVAFLVAGCLAYAAWALMPQALRRMLLAAVRKTPLRALFKPSLSRADEGVSGACGSCGNCSSAAAKPHAQRAATKDASQAVPLHFVPRARRR